MSVSTPFKQQYNKFVVKNISKDRNKTISIFGCPIPLGKQRDLLAIDGICEEDIRASLLKGELLKKMQAKEIVIVDNDIDILQFNNTQKHFLQENGIINGLQVSADNFDVFRNEDIQLVGDVNNINTVFNIPSGKFLQNATYKIIVYRNGVKQFYLDDFFVAESGGPGTGYDTIIFTIPPETTPTPIDVITADYYTDNT